MGDKFEITYTRSDYEDGISEVVFQNNPKNGFVELMIQSEKDIQVEIDPDKLLIEEDIYGMGSIYNGSWLVRLSDQGSENITALSQVIVQKSSWIGARTRFWTFLISPENHEATANRITESELGLKLTSTAEDGLHHFILYFGPLNTKQLVGSEPELRQLMYAALWDWLRQLCFFIDWIFFWLFNFSGNAGLSILLLACVLKVIIYPLNRVAEKWQDDVNITHSMLQPKIDEIKDNYYWVLLEHNIKYLHSALLNEKIIIKTYIEETKGVKSSRIVEIFNKGTNQLLVTSKTIWCLINAKTDKPSRINDEIRKAFS